MSQSFSRSAIASISLAVLVPVEVYANIYISKYPTPMLVIAILIATLLGAIVLGHVSRAEVRRSDYIRGGYGTGSAGMILGYAYIVIFSYFVLRMRMSPSLP